MRELFQVEIPECKTHIPLHYSEVIMLMMDLFLFYFNITSLYFLIAPGKTCKIIRLSFFNLTLALAQFYK